VYIRESHLSHAWNGDRVLVKVIKEGMGRNRRRSPEGEVCLVLERSNRYVLARVKKTEDDEFRAVPLDDRLLFEVALEPTEGIELGDIVDYLVSVEIQRYPLGRTLPKGKISKVLGVDAQSARDVDIVTCKYGLSEKFSTAAIDAAAGLPKLKKTLKAADVKGRLDVRSLATLAIAAGDGDESVPICDHAITIETNGNGHTRLGVHMTDVAHYIPVGSPLEREAQRRGLAAYLSETVLPLFPPEVSTVHGSFIPGQDRLGVSVLITLDGDGKRLGVELQPSAVRSDVVLTQAQLSSFFGEGKTDSAVPKKKAVQALLNQIKDVAEAVKQQRRERGGFDLRRGPEVDSMLQREGVPGVPILSRDGEQPGEGIIPELMIAANQAIAEHLQSLGIPSLYRCQAAPPLSDLQDAIKLASNVGLTYTLEDDAEVSPKIYQDCLGELAGPSSSSKILNT
ncbi:MAG: RNB domain-containing ribonuclease, partial [Cyanobacteria bacterium P01_H01_bin.130]